MYDELLLTHDVNGEVGLLGRCDVAVAGHTAEQRAHVSPVQPGQGIKICYHHVHTYNYMTTTFKMTVS
jgi:hypothetical protein